MDFDEMTAVIEKAIAGANAEGVRGKNITPPAAGTSWNTQAASLSRPISSLRTTMPERPANRRGLRPAVNARRPAAAENQENTRKCNGHLQKLRQAAGKPGPGSFARPAAPWKTQRRGPGGGKPGMRAAGA